MTIGHINKLATYSLFFYSFYAFVVGCEYSAILII